MESLVSPLGHKSSHQTPARKCTSGGSQKDLWSIAKEGSLSEVDSALLILKKHGGNIDARNMLGLTPLHIATWRNNIPIVRKLLAAGADPDARDGESGWSSLHRALHFGHLAVASILLQSGGSLTLEDSKRRIPTDLLSGPVLQVNGSERNAVFTEVFSWGSGANYQLGTGNAHIQKLPCRVDALQGLSMKFTSAAKFHSVAVGTRGELYTWGFGRGGRLGHPEFDIHSGQAAVITPRQVTCGLGSRRVKAIAAAKHHTVIATEGGEVFTWGSNREGQLGYTSVDSQPTPRRVSSLRTKVISVAAANKHTAVISESGEVFTWGCNKEGQLGYGTSNSASNYTPRVVEYLKGKKLVEIAAAKYHTIVLGADGEVFTWGHRLVTPRRVLIARNIKKGGDTQVKFHRMEKLHVVAVAAGMVHSLALTDDGSLFYWVSADPGLRCRQLYSMCGRSLVSISAGKYWTAAASSTGDIYMWDGKKGQGEPPIATRLHGVKRATSVSVGETHLLIVCALCHPVYPPKLARSLEKPRVEIKDEFEELEEGFMFDDIIDKKVLTTLHKDDDDKRPVPSLKSLCEQAAAEFLVEPRNAIQLLEIADSMGADELRKHCENIAMRNLDYIFTVSAQSVASASLEVLANLEKVMDAKSSESWSHRRLPTPTAPYPAIINSEEEDIDTESPRVRDNNSNLVLKTYRDKRTGSFLQSKHGADQAVDKQIRALRKKLQQIEMLEAKQANGHPLDDQQIAKLQTRSALEISLTELGAPVEKQDIPSSPALSDEKGSKKLVVTKKQKRKNRQKTDQAIRTPEKPETVEPYPIKGFLDGEICQIPKEKDGDNNSEKIRGNQDLADASLFKPKKDVEDGLNSKTSSPAAPKRKNKKGGLSMFLSGALDDLPQKAAPPPVTPKNEGPAWGGAKILKGPASLRDIQDEENKTRKSQPSRKVNSQVEDLTEGRNDGGIPLSSFLPIVHSSSIAVASSCTSLALEGEKNTPPWAAAGSSPISCKLSLRDIQMQQTKKNQQCLSHSPKIRTAGFTVTTGQGSPSDSSGPNRWFKPENNSASSIRSIQIEEKAMKDLKRFYSNVKKKELASCKIEQGNRKPSSAGLITLSSLSSLPLPQLHPTKKDDKPSELRISVSLTTPLEKDIIMKYSTSSSSLEDGEFRPLPSPPTQLQRPTNLVIKEEKHETTKKRKRSEVNKKGKEKVYVRAPARTMPKHMWDLITGSGVQGIDINWINTKLIYKSDIKKDQNRLLLSDPKEVEEVMKEEEIKSVRGSKINMEVHVFDPKLLVRKLNIAYWPKARRYALITRWWELAKGNGLKPKSHEVDIWSFRNQLGKLCFAVNFRRIRSEEEDEYLDPKKEDSYDADEEDSTDGAGTRGASTSGRCRGSTSGNIDTVSL